MALFRVFDARRRAWKPGLPASVAGYLGSLHGRFANGVHACTRVYECPEWRTDGERTAALELHWNDEPGVRKLGEFGWGVGDRLVAAVEAALWRGDAVRLVVFNSDSEVCFEELLAPPR